MRFLRVLFTPRHSTAAFIGGGLVAATIGAALGARSHRTVAVPVSPPPIITRGRPPASGADDEAAWRALVSRESFATRDTALAAALSDIAVRDPARALTRALAEPNALLRQTLLSAALRGWATVAPDAAADWTLERPLGERSTDVSVILAAVASDPSAAMRLAARLIRDDPALAHDHGCSLVLALAQQGDFAEAAAFAAQGSAALRESWLSTAFASWAEHQPESAARAALDLPGATDRTNAIGTVIASWSTLDPHALAEFSLSLPSDATRRLALRTALVAWANQDFGAASAWMNRLEPAAELDDGVAAVATQGPLIACRPAIAVSWAESILDSDLRVQTLAEIVGEWARTDPLAARRYAETSMAVAPVERARLVSRITPNSGG